LVQFSHETQSKLSFLTGCNKHTNIFCEITMAV
jgi:hypothetical protein